MPTRAASPNIWLHEPQSYVFGVEIHYRYVSKCTGKVFIASNFMAPPESRQVQSKRVRNCGFHGEKGQGEKENEPKLLSLLLLCNINRCSSVVRPVLRLMYAALTLLEKVKHSDAVFCVIVASGAW